MRALASKALVVSFTLSLALASESSNSNLNEERRLKKNKKNKKTTKDKPINIAVFGDWPYSQLLLDNAMDLVDSINDDPDVTLAVHLGDIHSGSMPCTGAGIDGPATLTTVSDNLVGLDLPVVNPLWNTHVFHIFNQFHDPLIFTPGDNEWTDCHKSRQLSSGAPMAELAGVRELFFPQPGKSMGRMVKTVTSQAVAFTDPTDAQFVENVRWMDGRVLFADFNMPGGSNNDGSAEAPWTGAFADIAAQDMEREEREAANLRWLDAAFDTAVRAKAKAVVILTQSDMWNTEVLPLPGLTNYASFVQRLATRSLGFGKPVLVMNGDSHVFKMDSPLVSNGATGELTPMCDTAEEPENLCDLAMIHEAPEVPNLRRITVQGSGEGGELIWLKLTINTNAKSIDDVFTYENVCYADCGGTPV